MTRILIADDSPPVRSGLRTLLGLNTDCEISRLPYAIKALQRGETFFCASQDKDDKARTETVVHK